MNDTLSVSELGALLDEARQTSGRLGEAEARLEKETRQRKAGFQRQLENELARLRQEQTASRERIKTDFRGQTEHLEKRRTAREARIHAAYTNTRKGLLARIDEIEGRRKFAVQKGILDRF